MSNWPHETPPGRCVHWPKTCAEVQARCSTSFRFCAYCSPGSWPPTPPSKLEAKSTLADAEREWEEIAQRYKDQRDENMLLAATLLRSDDVLGVAMEGGATAPVVDDEIGTPLYTDTMVCALEAVAVHLEDRFNKSHLDD